MAEIGKYQMKRRFHYLRFFLLDKRLRWLVWLNVLLIALTLTEFHLTAQTRTQIAQISKDRELIGRIPNMEQTLRLQLASRKVFLTPKPSQPKEEELIFYGTTIKDGVAHAIINNKIYTTGDRVQSYVIESLSLNTAVLRHVSTGKVKTLHNRELIELKMK